MRKAGKEGVGGGVRSTLSKLAVAAWVVSSEGTYKNVPPLRPACRTTLIPTLSTLMTLHYMCDHDHSNFEGNFAYHFGNFVEDLEDHLWLTYVEYDCS